MAHTISPAQRARSWALATLYPANTRKRAGRNARAAATHTLATAHPTRYVFDPACTFADVDIQQLPYLSEGVIQDNTRVIAYDGIEQSLNTRVSRIMCITTRGEIFHVYPHEITPTGYTYTLVHTPSRKAHRAPYPMPPTWNDASHKLKEAYTTHTHTPVAMLGTCWDGDPDHPEYIEALTVDGDLVQHTRDELMLTGNTYRIAHAD